MPKVDLSRLDRDGEVRIQERVEEDHPLLSETDVRFGDGVRVDLRATRSGSGEVVVRGTVQGVLEGECRRCLEPVRLDVDQEVTLVYAPVDEIEASGAGDVRPLPLSARDLDLTPALREELILGFPRYLECMEECRGLCPRCGTNLNVDECECVLEESDPRWEALRTLKET